MRRAHAHVLPLIVEPRPIRNLGPLGGAGSRETRVNTFQRVSMTYERVLRRVTLYEFIALQFIVLFRKDIR